MAIALFLIGVAYILWVTLGYPNLLYFITRKVSTYQNTVAYTKPSIAVLIIAYNEARVLHKKISNTLKVLYPKEKLNIYVVDSDSNDGTKEIVESFRVQGVKYLNQAVREGKASALQFGVQAVSEDLILATDANAFFSPDALTQMVSHFANPNVGGVTAAMRQIASEKNLLTTSSEQYWKIEKKIRTSESKLHSVIGMSGEAALFRRSILSPLKLSEWYSPGTPDDLSLSIAIVQRGYRLIYDSDADVWEKAATNYTDYFKQKIRIVGQTILSVRYSWPKLLRVPSFYSYFIFPNRKFFPLFVPFFTILTFVSALFLPQIYRLIILCFVLLLILFSIGLQFVLRGPSNQFLSIFLSFILLNAAVIAAWLRTLFGERFTIWEKVASTREDI